MNRLVLISSYWLLEKALVITTSLTNPESASEVTSDPKLSCSEGFKQAIQNNLSMIGRNWQNVKETLQVFQ